jgi:predicted RNA binding protein YcfA (HicA-like mRNA interferase family)
VPKLPACSSDQVVKALSRLGFKEAHTKGSHQTLVRERPKKPKDIVVVKLGASEMPRGTLRSILKMGNVSDAEFRKVLK